MSTCRPDARSCHGGKLRMATQSVRGCLDEVSPSAIHGWVSGPGCRFASIFLDGVEIARVRCDQYREDLKRAGVSDGYSAFTFRFPNGLDCFKEYAVEV